jgi:hypothetical protein
MGWNYVIQWAIVLPLELVVAGLTVNYWGAHVNVAVWITIFLFLIVLINVFGILGYAEEEFWVALLKLGTVLVFMIMAVIFACGGGPKNGMYGEYWAARTWYDPGAFADGFFGVCAVFVTAAFAFSGTELVGLAAAESETPQKSLPGAVKQVFWRITLYVPFKLRLIRQSTDLIAQFLRPRPLLRRSARPMERPPPPRIWFDRRFGLTLRHRSGRRWHPGFSATSSTSSSSSPWSPSASRESTVARERSPLSRSKAMRPRSLSKLIVLVGLLPAPLRLSRVDPSRTLVWLAAGRRPSHGCKLSPGWRRCSLGGVSAWRIYDSEQPGRTMVTLPPNCPSKPRSV